MDNLQVVGTIISISELKEGSTAKGDAYKALSFVIDTGAEYGNIFSFDLFQMGEKEIVDNFLKYNKVDQSVEVKFNIRVNKAKEGDRYYTSLSAWSVFTQTGNDAPAEGDDLPF